MLLIDDVMEKLQKFKDKHGSIEVCKIGHYGEINEMDDFCIRVRKAGHFGGGKRKLVVDINTPDIGPEPD